MVLVYCVCEATPAPHLSPPPACWGSGGVLSEGGGVVHTVLLNSCGTVGAVLLDT